MKNLFIYILILSAISINSSVADYNRKEDLTKQIIRYQSDIDKLIYKINQNKENIDSLSRMLKECNDKIILLSSIIDKTKFGSGNTREKLMVAEADFIRYKDVLDKLLSAFRKKVLWLYKNGTDYTLEVLFSSKSFNDFYTRLEYLNKISQIRKNDFLRIHNEQLLLEEKRKIAKMNNDEYKKYMKEKKDDYRQISDERTILENSIKQSSDDIENYNRQISRIEEYIGKTQSVLDAINGNYIYKTDSVIQYRDRPFSELKGLLILPVQSVEIFLDYGKSFDPKTKSLIYNNGVDVSISKGSEIKCVADGYVEEIKYIPLYGTTIIINHGDNYRTVYAVLTDINVSLGDRVSAGRVISKTSENLNGQSFHFELWKDLNPLDPKTWIKKGNLVSIN